MKLPRRKRDEQSATITQTLWLVLGCSSVLMLSVYASDPGSWNDPSWWTSRNAVLAPEVTTNGGVVTTNYIVNNNAAVNQGQLKLFTARAVDELNSRFTNGGAGTALSNLVYGWHEDYLTNGYNTTNIKPSDFTAMNVGQLKNIAGLVYGRLSAAGYPELTPSWLHQNTNTDNVAANLGQLKKLFDFDLSLPGASSLTATNAGTGTINLGWTLPTTNNVLSWLIEYQNTNGTWNVVTNLANPTATSYSVTGLTNGQSYNFQVVANSTNSVSTPVSASGTPLPTSGLALWLKPDAGLSSSSGNVTAWADQTSNHNNASPGSTPPTVITGGLAGYSAVHFDGSGNNYLVISDNASLQANNYTILAVAKENGIGSASQYLLCHPYRSGGFFNWSSPFISYAAILDQDSSTYLRSYVTTSGGSVDNNGANTYDTGRPHEFIWRYDGTNQDAYYDGNIDPSVSAATTGAIDYSQGPADVVIGRHSSTDLRGGATGEPLNGDLYEILVYNRALSDTERQQVETYLANKYGLYNLNATWPLAYSSDVQDKIAQHQWNKPQADAYVALQTNNSSMLTKGLTIWFKADDLGKISKDGSGNVNSWTDETGNYVVSQSGSARPTYIASDVNSKPGLRFNGSQWLAYSGVVDPGLNADITILSVGMTTTPSSQTYSIELGQNTSTGTKRAVGYYVGSEVLDTYNVFCSGSAAPTSGTFLAEATTIDPTLNNVAFYQNGAAKQTGSVSGLQNLSSNITVGASGGGASPWTGDIVEQLVYDHQLSPAELQQVSLYLSNKYALPYSPALTISPSGGSYTSSQTVSMSTTITSGVIHYTVDGTQPTASSATYTSAITVSANALVQAVVTVSGTIVSPVAAAQYYINDSGQTGLPIAPTSLTVTSISGTETDLAWTLTGMVDYSAINVYRSTNGGSYVLITVLDPGATAFVDLNVVSGNSYTYKVGTLNQAGTSNTAPSSSVSPPANTNLVITVTAPPGAISLP